MNINPNHPSTTTTLTSIPHRGALSRIHINIDNQDTSISYNQPTNYIYAINILSQQFSSNNNDHTSPSTNNATTTTTTPPSCQYQLQYHPDHYTFMHDLFVVLDTQSRGYITKQQLEEFVLLRCPVFKRRDATIVEFESTTTPPPPTTTTIHETSNHSKKEHTNVHYENNDTNEECSIPYEENETSQQNDQEIYNCILGEDFHSANDNVVPSTTGSSPLSYYEDADVHRKKMEYLGQNGEDDDDDVSGGFGGRGDDVEDSLPFTLDGDDDEDNEDDNEEEDMPFHTKEGGENNGISNNSTEDGRNVQPTNEPIQSQTFEEIWNAVIQCRMNQETTTTSSHHPPTYFFGIEAWMVFCRFISLAQYQDANRRFSARYLQQQIEPQRKNSDANEVILVDVPPPEKPDEISPQNLIEYELRSLKSEVNAHIGNIGIALPELDLDHSHLLIHDGPMNEFEPTQKVHVSVFGGNSTSSTNSFDHLEFVIRLVTIKSSTEGSTSSDVDTIQENAVVRRSYADVSWLHDTFKSQKHVSGTLCGRIIPPFPSPLGYSKATDSNDDNALSSSAAAISVASESAVLVTSAATSAAKSIFGSLSKSASKLKKVTKSSLKSSSLSSSDKKVSSSNQTHSLLSMTSSASGSGSSSSSSSRLQHGSSSSTIRKRHTKVKELILDNPSSKAKQLERYLNYMLDHPAMSTSFPLNVILRSSQAGVKSAVRILEKYKEENKYNPDSTNMNSQSKYYKFSLERYGITSDLSWVRSAAQAALALKLHGILETTGYQHTSTKLHHASLPKFSKLRGESDGVDESTNSSRVSKKVELDEDDDFEKGIICVESCLDEARDYDNSYGTGFDVLPLPIPLHKRSALCAGSSQMKVGALKSNDKSQQQSYQEFGTTYGDNLASQEQGSITVGDVSVDRDINRLRDMMRSVDKSLNSGFSAGLLIGAESCEKMNHQLDLLKEIDIGDGLCPRFISQNALLKGVESLERNRNALNECTEQFVNGFCWNSALATCAVAASDEVREAVTAARTAQRAKYVAEEAAKNAEHNCNSSSFPSVDEKMQAMSQASDLRSQAIYAAVIDHEALTAKRRAAVALARDVKCWNVHRKQELIKTCLKTVRSHQKLAFDSMCTWTEIKQSLLESQSVSNIVQSRTVKQQPATQIPRQKERNEFVSPPPDGVIEYLGEEDSTINPVDRVDGISGSFTQGDSISILHEEVPESRIYDDYDDRMMTGQDELGDLDLNFSLASDISASMKVDDVTSSSFVPSIDSATIIQSDYVDSCHYENVQSTEQQVETHTTTHTDFEKSNHSHSSDDFDIESSFHDTFQEKIPSSEGDSFPEKMPSVGDFTANQGEAHDDELKDSDSHVSLEKGSENVVDRNNMDLPDHNSSIEQSDVDDSNLDIGNIESNVSNVSILEDVGGDRTDNEMTESMQSLVDGLMNWGGGQWNEEEDMTPLPHGVAAL